MAYIDLKKQYELEKELDLANDQLKALESVIAQKNARISELVKQQKELSAIILYQSEELRRVNEKLEKRAGFFRRLW